MKELKQYFEMSDKKLEEVRKQCLLIRRLMSFGLIFMTCLFLFLDIYLQYHNFSVLILLVIVCLLTVSMTSKQSISNIEIIQEMKKTKIEPIASCNQPSAPLQADT